MNVKRRRQPPACARCTDTRAQSTSPGCHGHLGEAPAVSGEAALGGAFAERGDTRHSTLEGTPVVVDTFLGKQGDRCVVTSVIDMSNDRFGRCKILIETCPSLDAAASNDFERRGCTQREAWRRSLCL